MEASISRSFMKSTNRQFINTLLLAKCHSLKLSSQPLCQHTLSLSNPNSHPRNHFLNLKSSHFTPSSFQSNLSNPIFNDRFARIQSGHVDKPFQWKFAIDGVNGGELGFAAGDKPPVVTVAVLGWLGSKQKHLRRYAEMYNMFDMNAITFPAPVNDVIGFDLGRKFERRIDVVADEIIAWLEAKENDGRERLLIFHTFSNTGWLAYGYILNRLQGRQELLEKIKGCVVDSGGDPELDPKVWAAGFVTAILKKQSSAINSYEAKEAQNGTTNINADEKEPMFIEALLLALFEKFFAFILEFPDIKKRLTNITSMLSENQPCYPQLYLYSTADKVIPFQKIESFVEYQKKLGRKVTTFNFKSTPHVDHLRTFPDKYQSLIQSFLKDCFAAKGNEVCTS